MDIALYLFGVAVGALLSAVLVAFGANAWLLLGFGLFNLGRSFWLHCRGR